MAATAVVRAGLAALALGAACCSGHALAQSPTTGAPRGSAASAPVSAPSYTTQKDISGFHPPPNQLASNPQAGNAVSRGAPGAGANVPVQPASRAASAASGPAGSASAQARRASTEHPTRRTP